MRGCEPLVGGVEDVIRQCVVEDDRSTLFPAALEDGERLFGMERERIVQLGPVSVEVSTPMELRRSYAVGVDLG